MGILGVGGYPLTMGHMAYVDSIFSNFHKCLSILSDIKIKHIDALCLLRLAIIYIYICILTQYTHSAGFLLKESLNPFHWVRAPTPQEAWFGLLRGERRHNEKV